MNRYINGIATNKLLEELGPPASPRSECWPTSGSYVEVTHRAKSPDPGRFEPKSKLEFGGLPAHAHCTKPSVSSLSAIRFKGPAILSGSVR